MLTPPAERGLKDGHVSKGAVNQGYTGCYKEVNGIVVDPAHVRWNPAVVHILK